MKARIFFIFLLGIFIMICLGLFAFRHLHDEKIVDETSTVFIKKTDTGFQLYRNGKPFYIKGAAANSRFKELAEAGGNTIRVYDTINIANILNEAQKYNLAVIVDIPIPPYNKKYNSYLNEEDNRVLKHRITELVKKHKNHPSLLMWNLGNELHYPLVFRKNSFINTFNELIDIIHCEDPNHPVSSALTDVSRKLIASFYLHSPKIDLLGINTFGTVKKVNRHIAQISFLFGALPYYISEYGSDGWWESKLTLWRAPIEQTSTKKAEQIKTRYSMIDGNKDGVILGSLIFIWGYKFESTHTWFSLFEDNFKSEIIKELKKLWNNSSSPQKLIGLEYMLVDKKGAADNIVFSPNELKCAELKIKDFNTDSVNISWKIYPESWAQAPYSNVINPYKEVDCFKNFDNNKATFLTPNIAGPYRILAYVYDNHGYFASTNTPFYVLDPK